MKKLSAAVVGLVSSIGAAAAADMPDLHAPYPPLAVPYNWTGLYFGAHVGGGLGNSSFSDPAGLGIYGGNVRTPTALAGVQLDFNWQVPNTHWVLGTEADLGAMNAAGTNTCLASSGLFFSANCGVRQNALGTMTGRAGYATGPSDRTLLYARGGAAWLSEQIDITSNGLLTPATSLDGSRWGWTVGAGVEQALAPAWTVKMEYDYANFSNVDAPTPTSILQSALGSLNYSVTSPGTTSASQNIHSFKVGLNMKFGQDANARWDDLDDYHLRGSQPVEESNPVLQCHPCAQRRCRRPLLGDVGDHRRHDRWIQPRMSVPDLAGADRALWRIPSSILQTRRSQITAAVPAIFPTGGAREKLGAGPRNIWAVAWL